MKNIVVQEYRLKKVFPIDFTIKKKLRIFYFFILTRRSKLIVSPLTLIQFISRHLACNWIFFDGSVIRTSIFTSPLKMKVEKSGSIFSRGRKKNQFSIASLFLDTAGWDITGQRIRGQSSPDWLKMASFFNS